MRRIAALVAGVAFFLSACGGDGDPPTTAAAEEDRQTADQTTTSETTDAPTSTTSTTIAPTEATLSDYFAGITGSSATDVQKAMDASEAGSPAHLYGRYLLESTRALGGGTSATYEVTDTGVEVCEPEFDECYAYTDIRTNDQGQVVSFTINGRVLGDVLVGPGEPQQSGSVSVTRVMGYQSANGAVHMLVDVTNSGQTPVIPGNYSATYIGADGRQLNAGAYTFNGEVSPGATVSDLVSFELASLGGRMRYPVFPNDFNGEMVFELQL